MLPFPRLHAMTEDARIIGLHLVVILIDRLDVLALHQHGARTSGGDDGCKIINA